MGLSQTKFAAAGGVKKGAQIQYEADRRYPDAAYWMAIAVFLGADVQYILAGVRSVNLYEIAQQHGLEVGLENRDLQMVTQRVTRIAQRQPHKADLMALGPLRDLAYVAKLTDDQIQAIFGLLEAARSSGFWIEEGEKEQ